LVLVGAFACVLLFLVGLKVLAHRTPVDVKNPSLVLQAMDSAQCVGDLWGFDVYLARKNTELLAQSFPRTKAAMVGLFAEQVLQSAPWERPLDDLKYSFYVLRQEKIRSLSETTNCLIRLKETLRDFFAKDDSLDPKETKLLKTLREEELRSTPEDIAKRYQDLLWKSGSDGFKERLLVREASFEEQRLGQKSRKKIELIKEYEKKGELPFYLVLTVAELRKGPPASRALLEMKKRQFFVRESEVAIEDYQKALASLAVRDYPGFIEKAEVLADTYSHKDFGPVLLYQAWSVAHYDLSDSLRAETLLAKLKKKYPLSDWANPEKAPQFLTESPTKKAGKSWRSGFGKFLLPFNMFRGFFKEITENIFAKIAEVSEGLEGGEMSELILDNKSAESYLEPFLPSFPRDTLRGYQINLSEDGVDVFVGRKLSVFNIVFAGRGVLVPEKVDGVMTMRLRLRLLSVQGVPVPRAFLRQIEADFDKAVKSESPSMDLVEAKYWKGGAKLIFRKKEAPLFPEESTAALSGTDLAEKKS